MRGFKRWLVIAVFAFAAISVCRSQSSQGGGGGGSNGGSQQTSQNSKSGGGGGGQGGGQGGGSGSGSSIEAELLAYKALQSDSEAVACDIARFLHQPETERFVVNGPNAKGNAKNAPSTSYEKTCARSGASTPKGVILLSSAGTTLSNFQTWRMEMAEMTQLEAKATGYNCPSKDAEQTLSFAGLDIAQQAAFIARDQ